MLNQNYMGKEAQNSTEIQIKCLPLTSLCGMHRQTLAEQNNPSQQTLQSVASLFLLASPVLWCHTQAQLQKGGCHYFDENYQWWQSWFLFLLELLLQLKATVLWGPLVFFFCIAGSKNIKEYHSIQPIKLVKLQQFQLSSSSSTCSPAVVSLTSRRQFSPDPTQASNRARLSASVK